MKTQHWSFVLSWSRVGINAALFLAATRVLTLAEIGLFATAFAPIRLVQALQKAGLSDAVVMFGDRGCRWSALTLLAIAFGGGTAALFAILGALFSPMMLALSIIPFLNGLGAIHDGILRHRLAMKSLALRTLAAQALAAVLALFLLWNGAGAWALVAFAITTALLTNALSILLARWWPTTWPRRRDVTQILPKTAQTLGRVALNSSQMPLAQLAIGLTLGPAAAGAFQIATRMFELIDALTLSPLRFIALPRLSRSADLHATLRDQTRQTSLLAAWVWGGTLAATLPILTLAVGADHADAAAPILQALAPLGLMSALLMPITQALTAKGHTALLFGRAALVLTLSTVLMAPALALSPMACAAAITIAGLSGQFWLLTRALPRLGLHWGALSPMAPPLFAASMMVALLWLAPPMSLLAQITLGTATYSLLLTRLPRRRFA